jgi:hypothetical protein
MFRMDTGTSRLRRLYKLVYAQPQPERRTQSSAMPGPWYDATVFALLVVTAVGYFLTR